MSVCFNGAKKREWNLSVDPFPFEVLHIGEPANNMDVFHWHEFMELSFIQKGSGIYEIEDKIFQVAKGDIILINSTEKHRVTYRWEEPLYEIVIHFDPVLIKSNEDGYLDYNYMKFFKKEKAVLVNCPQISENVRKAISSLLSDIIDEYTHKNTFFQLMIKSKLLSIIILLLRQYYRQCEINPIEDIDLNTKTHESGHLDRILKYINESYCEDISLKDTAEKFFMNPSYFSEYFKKNVGENFWEYITKLRIKKAIKLLLTQGMSSIEVAFACGFNNVASFYNAFKRVTGMNPRGYMNFLASKYCVKNRKNLR